MSFSEAVRKAAADYLERGWCPLPLEHHEKKPTVEKDWPKFKTTPARIAHDFKIGDNIGIILGVRSGGLVDVDLDCPEALNAADLLLPETDLISGRVHAERSHRWYVMDPPPAKIEMFKDVNGASLVELRSTGGQTAAPPSVHPSGEEFEWYRFKEPGTNITIEHVAKLAAACLIARHWPAEGARHSASLALIGMLARAGWPQDEVYKFIEAVLEATNDEETRGRLQNVESTFQKVQAGVASTGGPSLEEILTKEVVTRVRRWLGLSKTPIGGAKDTNDSANARRLVERHGKNLKFCPALGWLLWSDTSWRKDELRAVRELAKDTMFALSEDKQESEVLQRWGRRSLNSSGISALLVSAETVDEIRTDFKEFDRNSMLVPCSNGTFNLKTGKLQPHNRDDLITHQMNVEYNPEAVCPQFDAYLQRVMGGDQEMVDFLVRMMGYSLTGDNGEQVFFFLHGNGNNGKSTLLEIMLLMGGDYAWSTPAQSFILKRSDDALFELASMAGKRVVVVGELPIGRTLNAALLKESTGGNRQNACHKYKNSFNYMPEYKLFLQSNNLLEVRDATHGFWRRLLVIPFDVKIPKDSGPKHLREVKRLSEKLWAAEAAGILALAIRGCLDWQKDGLQVPRKVQEASREYQTETDSVESFLKECCQRGPDTEIYADELHRCYRERCHADGGFALNARLFFGRLKRKGIKYELGAEGRNRWLGLRLRDGMKDRFRDAKPLSVSF